MCFLMLEASFTAFSDEMSGGRFVTQDRHGGWVTVEGNGMMTDQSRSKTDRSRSTRYPPRLYDPDSGWSLIFLGALFFLVCAWCVANAAGQPVYVVGACWAGLAGLGSMGVGIVRYRTSRKVGGKWPPQPTPPEQLPIEPFRYLSDPNRQGAFVKEPVVSLSLGLGLVAMGCTMPFLVSGSSGGLVIAIAVAVLFVATGAFPVWAGLSRWRWMVKYKRVVGHAPW